ncbi:MAG: hypothetical protein E6R03_11545 [Hyphomicrobiaceae bacterium]|nr:MAG: hypothetical protein E6R03_11545 [Hyphomicrobiaceae bacterium]
MSETQDTEVQVTAQDELAALKSRADMMGISYHPSIGLEKLREKVNAAIEGKADETKQDAAVVVSASGETEGQRNARLKKEASKLVRIRVSCMNPAKKEWEGEIFSIGNAVVGSFTKYVPFNTEDGWHVPHMMYQMIKDRECQVFYTVTDSRGNKTRKGKLIKEFNVEVLPPLTPEELHDLAQRQAMAKSID